MGLTNEKSIMHSPTFVIPPDQELLFAKRAQRFAHLADNTSDKERLLFWTHFCHAQHQSTEQFKDFAIPLSRFSTSSTPPFDRLKLLSLGLYDSIIADFLKRLLTLPLPSQAFSATKQEALVRTKQQKDQWRLWGQNLLNHTLPPQQLAEHLFIMGALQILYSLTASQLDPQSLTRQQNNLCPACGGTHSANLIMDVKPSEPLKFCSCLYCGTLWSIPRNQCSFCETTQNISLHPVENMPNGIFPNDIFPNSIFFETCKICRSYCKQLNKHENPRLDVFADDIAMPTLHVLHKGSFHFAYKNFNPALAENA
ncbi:formate dehydrogenase accessory protein FdhE [Bartonella machadoae]|uniref:formate dehydrogenase accessory protein FdhE n=1 Tax=Bartonella machadoae TaxID=2893471 RepID=UPI001F4C8D50|nr:formate dehydrogenase accessory protein FdhE [Bartonella machadoae]UNE53826.1 formate dehydrogenase accessory protein FdhE [Bartonella machadoae]